VGLALLFPGQGSQYPNMFARIASDPAAFAAFDEAQAVLGYDIRTRDDVVSLASTVNVQLALLVAGVASAVGGFAAAVTAGSMAFADALRAVQERACAMGRLFPSGYGMGVVAGLPERSVREIVHETSRGGAAVYIANVNAPTQCVIAGQNAALELALDAAKAAGARRADRLDVAVPSHCPLLAPVQARLADALAQIEIRDPRITYVGSVGPRLIRDARGLREDLAAGVAHEVRWHDASTMLVEMGVNTFVEVIPGHVLTDLARAAFPRVRAIALDDVGAQSAASLARRA